MSAEMPGLPVPPVPEKPVTLAIVGAGSRGQRYAKFAMDFPQWVKVVAVAEPDGSKRDLIANKHRIPPENVFSNWTKLAKQPRLCDAVVICTLDHLHTQPAIAFANLKYNMLLEKPMAVCLQDCQDIVEAVKRNEIIFGVGHFLRYTRYTTSLMKVLNSKQIGDVVNIQHLEPIGHWHFAHSYVRGNWANESRATFSLMAKSCHDIDVIPFLMGAGKCKRISSFGSLRHFRKENKPKEAGKAKKCSDCEFESKCPYSADKIYIEPFLQYGHKGWPRNVVHPNNPEEMDIESLTDALKNTKYGSCVYELDNNVCDQQIVNMEFENGSTASFTMIAFTEALGERKTRIFGTRGEIEGDGVDKIVVLDFRTGKRTLIKPSEEEQLDKSWSSGRGPGDYAMMQAFVQACATSNCKYILAGPDETLESHIYVFAAEESRKTHTVVDIEEFKKTHLNNHSSNSSCAGCCSA